MAEPWNESYVERRQELTRRLQDQLVEVLQLDCEPREVGRDTPLFGAGLGLDSIDAVAIAATVESEFGVAVNDGDIQVFRSVNTIVDFVLAAQGEMPPGWAPSIPRDDPGDSDREAHPEYWALREAVGLLDLSPSCPIHLPSPDWGEVLDRELGSPILDLAVGDLRHTAWLDELGRVVDLLWVGRSTEGYLLISEGRSRDFWRRELADLEASLPVECPELEVPTVIGPAALEVVVDLLGDDLLRLGYGEIGEATWRGTELPVMRLGGTGELEYRFPVDAGLAAELVRELRSVGEPHGLRACDAGALPTLHLEMKSIDVRTMVPAGTGPAALDLHWMVAGTDSTFRGREAYRASLDSAPRRSVLLVAPRDRTLESAARGQVLRHGRRTVGEVWTARFSPRLGAILSLGFVDDDVAWPGLELDSEAGPWLCLSAPAFLTRSVLDSLAV